MEQPSSTPAVNPPAPSEPPRKAKRLGESSGGLLAATITLGGRSISLVAILAGVAVLVVLAILILPPVQLPARISWLGCTEISAKSPSADGPDGLNVSLADSNGGSLRLKMGRTPQEKLPAAALKAMPPQWTPLSPMYQTGACGDNKALIVLSVPATIDAASADTIDLVSWDGKSWQWVGGQADFPNSAVVAQLGSLPPNVMAVQTAPVAPVVGAELASDAPISDKAALVVNEYAVPAFLIANDGTLQGDVADLPAPIEGAQAMWAVTRNWAPDGAVNAAMVEDVLIDARLRAAHVKALTEVATRSKYDGIMVDYRGLSSDSRAAFTKFITELAASLHKNQKRLAVVLPQPVQRGGEWDTAGYDWQAIGAVADVVQVDAPNDPAAFTSRRVENMLRWAVGQVNRVKLQVAIPSTSVKQTGNIVQTISHENALEPFKTVTTLPAARDVSPGAEVKFTLGDKPGVEYDEASRMYRYTLTASDGVTSTIWLNTGASLSQKLGLALRFNLRGAMVKGLLTFQEPGVWPALEQYQAQATAAIPARLQVVWTVRSADGAQLPGGASTLTDTTYVWTAPTNPGKYTIAAALPGSATRGELGINVVQPTPAPTPQPATTPPPGATSKCPDAKFVADVTVPDNSQFDKSKEFVKTWKVSNSGACDWPAGTLAAYASGEKMGAPDNVQIGAVKVGETVQVSVKMKSPDKDGNFQATWRLMDDKGNLFGEQMTAVIIAGQPQAAASGGGAAPPPVPAGTAGGLELGGQVDSFNYPDKMHYAGMNWVKHQVPWGPGAIASEVAGTINAAHAKGFKVLLSVLGGAGDAKPVNFPSYAAFVGGLAALGPDAIEIWNEENIEREWQKGTINGATYTELLKQSYNAIKNANRNVMVVSGALAPTGYAGAAGCIPELCNDDTFLAQMAAAGAANYMDCVGVHHNAGATSPSATSGHPSAYHYSWYFMPTLNLYYNAFGRKACFTEFGYLSPEGYGGLPQNFAWARNTTVAQQAQWLAEAASLSASSGKVRLMIIFNVDFTYYGDDPQAGYAIIRPGNSCPACETLHQVLGTRSR